MEKLLKALKEYWVETFDDKKLFKIEYEEKSGTFYWIYQPLPGMKLKQGQMLHRTTVLSKEFGFIEWLVENNKIDIKKLIIKGEMRSGWNFENKKGDEEVGKEIWNKYYSELTLMLLSIQKKPLEFLISLLK